MDPSEEIRLAREEYARLAPFRGRTTYDWMYGTSEEEMALLPDDERQRVQYGFALSLFRDGYTVFLEELIVNGTPVPGEMRGDVRDIVAGRSRPPVEPRRIREVDIAHMRDYATNIYQWKREGAITAKQAADFKRQVMEQVAEATGAKPSYVSKVWKTQVNDQIAAAKRAARERKAAAPKRLKSKSTRHKLGTQTSHLGTYLSGFAAPSNNT